jgi:8-oxo-dGTP diphosphatase
MITVELVSGGSEQLKVTYVVVAPRHRDGWLFVRHRRRGGYELPAGHPDDGEESLAAAVRELTEETGAMDFILEPVTYYSVDAGQGKEYGRLFYAEVESLGKLTDNEEIEGVRVFRRIPRKLSLPEVMSFLFRVARQHAGSV